MMAQSTRNVFTRDFILCFFAQFAFASVIFILLPTLPIYLSRLGSTEVEIGILIGAFGISSLVLRPIVGRSLLKISEKSFMMAGAILFFLTSAAYLFAHPFWPFFIVRITQGIAAALFFTAAILFITNITSDASRGQSIGHFFLSFNVSLALAPPFGMVLINHFDFRVLFLVCIALSLFSLLICAKLGRRRRSPVVDLSVKSTPLFNLKAFPPTFVYFVVNAIWGALTTFFPLYAIRHGVTNPGLFFAAYAAVVILGRTAAGRILDLYQREKIILLCHITFIISMALLAFSETESMFMVVAVVSGVGHAFIFPSLIAHTVDLAGASRGPALGLLMGTGDLGMVLGPTIMGIILRMTNFTAMFLCVALTALISFVYFFLSIRKGKREDEHS
jgi:predicted MFS family arabinose efflux permease